MNEALENILPQLPETEYTFDGVVCEDTVGEYRDEYAEYLIQRVASAHNFQNWFEQTYGKQVSSDQMERFLGAESQDLVETMADGLAYAFRDMIDC